MKKVIACILAFCLLLSANPAFAADELMDITRAAGYKDVRIENRPKASIVIDGKTGDILWEDNIDAVRDPASMSKVLALYLVFEAMGEGKFSPETVVKATATDQSIADIYKLSNNKIVAGVDYTVSELILATLVPSSNAATLMLARLVEEDPDLFIDKMNAKAQELGMTNSKYYNASGAAASAFQGYYAPKRYDIYRSNETTARDYGILTYHFLKNYPSILDYTGASTVKIKVGTPYEESFDSYNYSLPDGKYGIEGVTGLKTGSSPSAAFNLTATAKRGDQEIIAVLLGVGNWVDQNGEYYRHPFANALMEKAFKDYDYKEILGAGKQEISGTKLTLEAPIYGTVPVEGQASLTYENGRLQLQNGLKSVSPLIEKEKENTLNAAVRGAKASGNKASVKSGDSSQLKHLLVLLVIILVLFVLLILVRHWIHERRRARRRRAQNRNPRR